MQDDPTREAIVGAARRILTVEGPAGLTIRKIATAAGHSTMAVYSRFGGKDGLVDELFTEGFTRLTEALEAVIPTDDPLADLDQQGAAYRRFALDHPQHYSLMFDRPVPGDEPGDATVPIANGALDVLARGLARAMEHGALAEADPLATAVAVWGTCHGLVSLEMAGSAPPGIDWAATYEHTCHALLRGLAPS
ncbi:MAG: TetR/AcrR family transcriptional regulator [Ilumatobacter sp.]|nr:MAG: TetR/AcrR family transcriptional regulator [Ilumatobacter sp.]